MKLIKKMLGVSVAIAIFCIIGFQGSLEVGVLDLRTAIIYTCLAIIYIGVAIIACKFLGQAEKERGYGRF